MLNKSCIMAIVLLAEISPIIRRLMQKVKKVPVTLHDKVLTMLLSFVSKISIFQINLN